MDYVSLMMEASIVAKLVLLSLIVFSIVCWVLIVQKTRLLNKTQHEAGDFLSKFRGSGRLTEVRNICDAFHFAPQADLFIAGYNELQFQLKHRDRGGETGPKVRSLDSINRVLQRASFIQVAKLEKNLNMLATTASVAPFIGLLGTVWGIIEAFADIGQQKSASLAVVAPGIAEALIATAFGLFAAIPAVMAYNYFVNRVRLVAAEMEDFCLEFVGIVEKNFT